MLVNSETVPLVSGEFQMRPFEYIIRPRFHDFIKCCFVTDSPVFGQDLTRWNAVEEDPSMPTTDARLSSDPHSCPCFPSHTAYPFQQGWETALVP